MIHSANLAQSFIETFARGGGGGSGSGGGGGGIIFVVGYLPTHFWGAFLRRKMQNPVGLALMIVVTFVYGILWWFLGAVGFLVSLGAFVGGPAGYFGWFGKVSAHVRKQAQQEINVAANNDPAWNEETLVNRVKEVFDTFQHDWSTFNTANLMTYMTPTYAYHTQLMLLALQQRQRRNDVQTPKLLETYPTDVEDEAANSQDRVTFYVHGQAHDVLLETINNQQQQLFVDNGEFYEFWHFVRTGNTWLLDDISQYTEDKSMARSDVKAFAAANNLYYSLDWGWLLLPRRGQLFKGGKFGKSDINNHVIGVYNNLLVELYTYISKPDSNDSNATQYVIAQVALPKRYDSLIVEAKEGGLASLFHRPPKGYNKLSLEWPDFNKRYRVFATNVEQVTAFELLHPVYMEKLFALPFKISIEVVDNVIYLYTKDKKADYSVIYDILKDAFKEMRL